MAERERRMVEPDGQGLLRLRAMELERRYLGRFGEDAHLGVVHLELRLRHDAPVHLDHRLRQEVERLLEHDLREPGPVAHEEERHVGEPPLLVQPALQDDPLAGMRRELRGENTFHLRHLPSTTRLGVRAGGAPAVPPHFAARGGLVVSP
jgi:hypothetical protein